MAPNRNLFLACDHSQYYAAEVADLRFSNLWSSDLNSGLSYIGNKAERGQKRYLAMAVRLEFLPGNVYVLTLVGDGEHRFTPQSIPEIMAALDKVEADPKACALVTTGEGKFYSNGLSLSLEDRGSKENMQLIDQFHALLKRILTYPIPTVAAVNGHAVAGGCMVALAHDYRFMRADRGFMFLSEIDIKLPFSPGMNAIIRCKLPVMTYHKAMLSAFRYTGQTAVEAGMVHSSPSDLQSTYQEALKLAKGLASRNFDRVVYQTIKKQMFKAEIKELEILATLEPIVASSKL